MVGLISLLVDVLSILIILYVIFTYLLPPTNAVRAAMARVIEPMLEPIRRMLPTTGGLDFSPVILLLLIILVGRLLTRLFSLW